MFCEFVRWIFFFFCFQCYVLIAMILQQKPGAYKKDEWRNQRTGSTDRAELSVLFCLILVIMGYSFPDSLSFRKCRALYKELGCG